MKSLFFGFSIILDLLRYFIFFLFENKSHLPYSIHISTIYPTEADFSRCQHHLWDSNRKNILQSNWLVYCNTSNIFYLQRLFSQFSNIFRKLDSTKMTTSHDWKLNLPNYVALCLIFLKRQKIIKMSSTYEYGRPILNYTVHYWRSRCISGALKYTDRSS